jgi:hypothetical protein
MFGLVAVSESLLNSYLAYKKSFISTSEIILSHACS